VPNQKKRIAIIASHPIQYYVPIYRELARDRDLEVRVFYGSDFSVRGYRDREFGVTVRWDVPLTEGYDFTFLSTDEQISGASRFFEMRPTDLARQLREYRPDCALISAYLPFFWWEALAVLRSLGIPVLLRAETTDVARSRSTAKHLVRTAFLKLFYRQIARFLAIGQISRQHYLSHGVPPGRIGWAPYCVDSELIEKQRAIYHPQRSQVRQELGFTEEDTVFVFAGKLIPVKNVVLLVRALQLMPEAARDRVGLIVLGDGELFSSMESECRRVLGSRSVFTGFMNQSEMGRYYSAADCLVLPSLSETWGLVVNEALQYGLPAIVSDRVGCHPDLIVEGRTGYVFPTGDAGALRDRMLRIRQDLRSDAEQVSRFCRRHVAGYSAAAAAKGIREGVLSVLAS
jgi:glycosyltransferase involved in cell wall biosynthesis